MNGYNFYWLCSLSVGIITHVSNILLWILHFKVFISHFVFQLVVRSASSCYVFLDWAKAALTAVCWMQKSPTQNQHRVWVLPYANSSCLYSSLSIPMRLLCSLSPTSWSLSTLSSPRSSRTMLSRWSICAATSGPSRAWTTAMSSSQQSKTPGCPTWLMAAAGRMARTLPKVGMLRLKLYMSLCPITSLE